MARQTISGPTPSGWAGRTAPVSCRVRAQAVAPSPAKDARRRP